MLPASIKFDSAWAESQTTASHSGSDAVAKDTPNRPQTTDSNFQQSLTVIGMFLEYIISSHSKVQIPRLGISYKLYFNTDGGHFYAALHDLIFSSSRRICMAFQYIVNQI
jgi:hypothetical protein